MPSKPAHGAHGASGNNELQTPRPLFAALNESYLFDFDPFASKANRLLPSYSTMSGTFFHGMRVSYRDGLQYPWEGKRVFANPPYGRGIIDRAIEKMVDERNRAALIVALLRVDTSTRSWRLVEQYGHIDYLPRIAYLDPAKPESTSKANFASAIVTFRKDWMRL